MRKKSCQICMYWFEKHQTCRRYPPTAIEVFSASLHASVFPVSGPNDWCGEYKYRSEKEDEKNDSKKEITDGIINHYREEFKKRFGSYPTLSVKDRNAAKMLARDHDLDTACKLVTEFIVSPTDWIRDNKCYDLKFIPSQANSILSRRKGVAEGDIMSFLKSQANHRHEERWFEYVDYVKKSNKTITFEEWSSG